MQIGWLHIILCLLQITAGIVIVSVELVIIKMESPGTPSAFSLLHQEVAVKGGCNLIIMI